MDNSQESLYERLQSGQIIGPDHHQFKLTTQLKASALGQLWCAEDLSTRTSVPVTLQLIHPLLFKHNSFLDTFQKHVSLSKKLSHPHLAAYYGLFKHKGGLVFYATELLDGLTLAQLLNSGGHKKLSIKQKHGLLIQLAQAVDTAHAKLSQPHRTLSPEVIYINKKGGVKLTGFALDEGFTQASNQLDTLPNHMVYRAPESFHPVALSTKADIYAFTCIIYHLLSGDAPFRLEDDESIRIHKELKKPAVLNTPQWQLLQQGFATDPDSRPASASELLRSILLAAAQKEEKIQINGSVNVEKPSKKLLGFNIPGWLNTPLTFALGFLLGFAVAFFIGLNTANNMQMALSQSQQQLATAQQDNISLQQTLTTQQQAHESETAQQQQVLEDQIVQLDQLREKLLKVTYDDSDALTFFTDQLDEGFKGPKMIIMPRGIFSMGDQQLIGDDNERPVHEVSIRHRFAISRNEVTFNDYDYYATMMGRPLPKDNGWGRGNRPVINISWKEAKAYVQWLSLLTGQPYRLPTEAEWEYAARAGTDSNFWWGNEIESERAVCGECNTHWDGVKTAPVASYPANSWGIHDMNGNVDEWVEDCYQESYFGATTDGSAMLDGSCEFRVMRGGSWFDISRVIRSSSRYRHPPQAKKNSWGFRIALDLPVNN
ncbi:MAG: bifunctional serine/threonine-protein kinase/formylglycine-generating enzyme family protein [Amphritea sp.]